jgi:tryptophanyl-tRNA synthetase
VPADDTKRKRVLSGMRPTGRLHIGHYFGALANWVKLQNDPAYECFYFIADWHALTSDYADTSQVAQNTIEIAIDFMASGLDPEKSTIFVQSQVPEHAELDLLLGMITPLGWLERVPTYKEALDNVQGKDLHMYGFLGYPVLQTADIVIYGEPDRELIVPVGEDQVAHIELSREIVRGANFHFGFEIKPELTGPYRWENLRKLSENIGGLSILPPPPNDPLPTEHKHYIEAKIRTRAAEIGIDNFLDRVGPEFRRFFRVRPVLREPDVMLTHTPRIPGTDGRKMSKSYGNTVMFADTDEAIWEKIRPMVTDPARKRRTDPGDPDVCPVYDWHKLFSPPETLKWSASGCRSAAIGCIECKRAMADNLIKWIAPVRERRRELESHPARVLEILDAGSRRARTTAVATMERVREAVFGWKQKRAEIAQSQNISSAGTKA